MTIKNNKSISITTGASRKATTWTRADMLWTEFIVRLQTPIRSPETQDAYLALPKAKQDDLKDVGGFVGGTFAGTRRKANAVTGRDLVTLDLDNIPTGQTGDILRRVSGLGCAAVVYSTRKHSDYTPRLRVVIPLDMTAEPDEYEPVARRLAAMIGMQHCDPTTFEASRLMYWPSVSNGAPYICEVYDKPFCDKFAMLGTYTDWTDISEWPTVPGEDDIVRRAQTKAEDPLTKKGIVGAFCRTYTVTMAIARFIPGAYEYTDIPGRLTYAGGSTTGGAVLYGDDRYLYSHHATDPVSGKLVNAWDLVRIHKYGDLDDTAPDRTTASGMPSYKAMQQLATEDDAVRAQMALEKQEHARDVFGDVDSTPQPEQQDSIDWITGLAIDRNGEIEKTIDNVMMILENDPLIKGRFVTDVFKRSGVVIGALPWDSAPYEKPRLWGDADDAGLRWYLEKIYRLSAREKTYDATAIVGHRVKINAVADYLKSLTWDGVKRVDTLFMDYLGAEDTAYTRAITRKTLCAACARAVMDGVKFDYMPIIIGPQGIGKSTLLSILGKEWFSDSLSNFEGKDAAEMLRGVWINEVGELSALSKSETNTIKQFLSKTHDIYRAAYSRQTDEYPRKCIFIGTSNHHDVLRDETGNRRFWPVDVAKENPTKDVWRDLPNEVDQIWAEAFFRYQLSESLYLPRELEREAQKVQESHEDDDGLSGTIAELLERKIPKNWYNLSPDSRRSFLEGRFSCDEDDLVERERVCAKEIYVDLIGGYPSKYDTREAHRIKAAMRKVRGWEPDRTPQRYGNYGAQRGYRRIFDYKKGETL